MSAKVGNIVKSYCARCKSIVESTVDAAIGAEIISVTCRACATSQSFEAAPKPDKPVARQRRVIDVAPRRNNRKRGSRHKPAADLKRAPTTPTRPAEPQRSGHPRQGDEQYERWNQQTDGVDSRFGRPHRDDDYFETHEIILDHEHGMGIVSAHEPDGTLVVLFRDGIKKLPSKKNEVADDQ